MPALLLDELTAHNKTFLSNAAIFAEVPNPGISAGKQLFYIDITTRALKVKTLG